MVHGSASGGKNVRDLPERVMQLKLIREHMILRGGEMAHDHLLIVIHIRSTPTLGAAIE